MIMENGENGNEAVGRFEIEETAASTPQRTGRNSYGGWNSV